MAEVHVSNVDRERERALELAVATVTNPSVTYVPPPVQVLSYAESYLRFLRGEADDVDPPP